MTAQPEPDQPNLSRITYNPQQSQQSSILQNHYDFQAYMLNPHINNMDLQEVRARNKMRVKTNISKDQLKFIDFFDEA